jgi:hypothetical protein
MFAVTEFEIDDPASCLDCRHWCIRDGCALAGDPAVDAFTDPYNGQDADMRHCPGFEEV